MLVLQSKEIPHETSEHFKRRQNRRQQIARNVFRLGEHEAGTPRESQNKIFDDREIIECLRTRKKIQFNRNRYEGKIRPRLTVDE